MLDGEPQFAAIEGTQLAYVSNTASDVFVDQAHGLRGHGVAELKDLMEQLLLLFLEGPTLLSKVDHCLDVLFSDHSRA